jgi:3,5-dihydroxyphenylacetyl-CoA synthase
MNQHDGAPRPRILSVGTSHPPTAHSQDDLLRLFKVSDPKIKSLFRSSHIANRYLVLPEPGANGEVPEESSLELAAKHRREAIAIGREAIAQALAPLGLTPSDVDYLVCVTTTGFLCPGLTAHLIADLGFRRDVHRIDVVGMGCNAGLNALQPLADFCARNPGRIGVQLCVEICSAAYVFDMTMRTSVVNCLFGDGAAAIAVCAGPDEREAAGPSLLGFASHIIPEAIGAMRFDFDGVKNSFFLDKEIPYVIGQNVHVPVDRLLARFGLKRRHVAHWVVHSGGKKVIDSIKYSLDLTDHDLRHTQSVLRDYGNLSSGSFLFSLQRLLREGRVSSGDHVMLMTMGPGSTIECCLGRF